MRNLIIGLSLIFFISSIMVTIKALSIPVREVDDQQFVREINSETNAAGKDQQRDHTLKEATKKHKETLQEIEAPGKTTGEIIRDNTQKASRLIYTIQTGSFTDIKRAQKQFDRLAQGLNVKELNNLRIEKIGKFYSVRLGTFVSNSEAIKTLEYVRSQMPACTIVKTRFMQERIEMMYRPLKR